MQAPTATPMSEPATTTTPQATVIVGSGLAGWSLARELRARSPEALITVISAGTGDFYSKPMLSNALALNKTATKVVSASGQTHAEKLGVTLRAHTSVTAIDTAKKTLATTAGTIPYHQLVLALGADPIRLNLPGSEHILSVNDLDAYATFRAQLAQAAHPERGRVLIMGAGLIGCEFANDLAKAGHTVHVVDPGERVLGALLPAEDSHALQTALAALGVQFHFGMTAQRVDHRVDTDTQTPQAPRDKWVTLSNGKCLCVDVVLSAVGLRARTELAQGSDLHIGRGIVVDAWGQTSAPDVYALGDCAAYASAATPTLFDGAPRGLPFVMPLMTAAKALAQTLAGTATPIVFGPMTVRVKTPAYPVSVQA
jgi:rubredoxin---NAD+ reductase